MEDVAAPLRQARKRRRVRDTERTDDLSHGRASSQVQLYRQSEQMFAGQFEVREVPLNLLRDGMDIALLASGSPALFAPFDQVAQCQPQAFLRRSFNVAEKTEGQMKLLFRNPAQAANMWIER